MPETTWKATTSELHRGGVAGLYTIMGSIVMRDNYGEMWAAFIDDQVVRYFSNAPSDRNRLRATIENWRSRFSGLAVRY